MTNIKGIGQITTMDNIAMTAVNIFGMKMGIVDTSLDKPLLYQFAWMMLKFVESKKFVCWLSSKLDFSCQLVDGFYGKLHQFFKNLVLFLQNSINTNSIEHNLIRVNLGKRLLPLP